MLAALIRPIFGSESGDHARELVGDALERLRKPLPKIAALLEEAEEDLLAFYAFPADHWTKLRSTNPLEHFNREIGRRTDVVGIFPNDRSLLRLAASIVIEQNDCVSDSVNAVRLGSEAHRVWRPDSQETTASPGASVADLQEIPPRARAPVMACIRHVGRRTW
jgi:transposase-like protein